MDRYIGNPSALKEGCLVLTLHGTGTCVQNEGNCMESLPPRDLSCSENAWIQ